jgi:hypothetical protein
MRRLKIIKNQTVAIIFIYLLHPSKRAMFDEWVQCHTLQCLSPYTYAQCCLFIRIPIILPRSDSGCVTGLELFELEECRHKNMYFKCSFALEST